MRISDDGWLEEPSMQVAIAIPVGVAIRMTIGRGGEGLATGEDGATTGNGVADMLLNLAEPMLIDQWADLDAGLETVADLQRGDARSNLLGEGPSN
jgi:hypothetical protein